MIEMKPIQMNNSFILPDKRGNHYPQTTSGIYTIPYDAITRESVNESIYSLPISDSPTGSHNRFNASISSLENSPVSLTKRPHYYANITRADSGILTDIADIQPKPQTMLISVPFEITENLVCYAQVSANYLKDMSSTNSTLLYYAPNRGGFVVKDFGDDTVIEQADRMYQEIDATMEVFIAQLGKKLQVNVPKSWILPNAKVKNTTVVSEYIKHAATQYPDLRHGYEALKNNHSFIKTYHDSKLPVFHYLINHPHVQINPTTYANILIRNDCELYSIDHEGCLKQGRQTPKFTAEQINQFFPDQSSYEKFKKMSLTDEVNSAFGAVVKGYDKKVSDIDDLNIADFEFRKNHLIQQYEKFNASV